MLLFRFRLCPPCPWEHKAWSRWSASCFLTQLCACHPWAQEAWGLALHGQAAINADWAQAAHRSASPSGTLCQALLQETLVSLACLCAHFKYTRKELVKLDSVTFYITEHLALLPHLIPFCVDSSPEKNHEWVAGLGNSHRIQLPIFVADFSETFLCSAFLRSMPQCLLIS